MNKPKMYGTEIAYVRWFDSAVYAGVEPFRVEDLAGYKENESCGILIGETKDSVTVALDRCPETGYVRLALCIPKANVRFLRKVKV